MFETASGVFLPAINPLFETKELKCSESEYHAIKDAAHYSSLKHMIKSPHAYYWEITHPRPPTQSMHAGTLAHKAILEGKHFLEDYIVEPIFRGLTKDGKETTSANATSVKEARAEWVAGLLPNQKVVTQDEYDNIGFMMESLVKHKFVQEIFKEGRPEVRGQFLDPVTQIGCTFAHDFLTFDSNTWVDLKTCQSSDAYDFRRSVEKLRYDLQMAMYCYGSEKVFGKKPKEKVWIAIESAPPYEVKVHYVGPYFEEIGLYEFRQCMGKLKQSILENKWPQGQNIIESLDPSVFFERRYDQLFS